MPNEQFLSLIIVKLEFYLKICHSSIQHKYHIKLQSIYFVDERFTSNSTIRKYSSLVNETNTPPGVSTPQPDVSITNIIQNIGGAMSINEIKTFYQDEGPFKTILPPEGVGGASARLEAPTIRLNLRVPGGDLIPEITVSMSIEVLHINFPQKILA